MALRHLTDEEIQNYLDGNTSQQDIIVEDHLGTCGYCQNILKQYQSLYVGLKDDQSFKLSSSFAKSIISKLWAEPLVKPRFNYSDILLMVAGIIIALGTTLYYVDLKPLVEIMTNISLPQVEFNSTLLASVKSLLASLNRSLSLLAFVGLILLIIAAIDHIVFQPKYKWLLL